jgi:hypothetical protein
LSLSWSILCLLLFAATLLTGEPFIVAAGLLPVLGMAMTASSQPGRWRMGFRRGLLVLGMTVVLAGVFGFLVYRGGSVLADRGMSISLRPDLVWQRTVEWYERFTWMNFSSAGRGLTSAAWTAGWKTAVSSWQGIVSFGLALLSLLGTILAWRSEGSERIPRLTVGLTLALAGLAFFPVAVLFPGVLLAGQPIENRLLYFPALGLCLAVAAVFWMAARALRARFVQMILVGAAGAVLVVSTICTLGYSQAYAARYRLDERQIAAVSSALPADLLPAHAIIVPFAVPGELDCTDAAISMYFTGVFETPWSARAALRAAYRRGGFEAITMNRWGGMLLKAEPEAINVGGAPPGPGTQVDPARTILFTIRDGRALIVRKLVLRGADGVEHAYEFPLAARLRERGTPTIEIAVPEGVAAFDYTLLSD